MAQAIASAPVQPGIAAPPAGMGSLLLGVLSQSSGSILVDAGVGALVGYAIAPSRQRFGYVAAGAAATGIAGVLGLAGLLGYRYYRMR